MDVVHSNITSMKGQIEIESVEGQGTTIRLIMPLTTAITDGVLVLLGKQRYVIPTDHISEFITKSSSTIAQIDGGKSMLEFRNEFIPVINFPGEKEQLRSRDLLIVLQSGDQHCGLLVDQVVGQSQVVLKTLGTYVGEACGFSGAAILGDGCVGLVLDVNTLVSNATHR